MARPLRLEFPGAIYHVTSRGNARADIFLGDVDRDVFLSILADTAARHNWFCHAYCLMGNHYHLLIETPDPNLSLGMRQLNGVYTQAFNRQHQRCGHVFQGRYKAILVEKDTHLLQLCRYVVLNPVAAEMVSLPEQWVWSSYLATAGVVKGDKFLVIDWILAQFARHKWAARRRYVEFVQDGLSVKTECPWRQLKGQIFYGSSRFIAALQDQLDDRQDIGEIPREQRYPGRPPLPEIFTDLANKQERNLKIKLAHRNHGYTLQQIADVLGVHYSTVSRIAKMTK